MKTYILTRTGNTVIEVKADSFTFDAATRSVVFYSEHQERALAAYMEIYSVEEKPE